MSYACSLKNKEGLQWFARQATTWLLKKVKEKATVKLQAVKETQSPGAQVESDRPRKNDLSIRDCGLYFADKSRGYGVLMVTMVNNLSLEFQTDGMWHICEHWVLALGGVLVVTRGE